MLKIQGTFEFSPSAESLFKSIQMFFTGTYLVYIQESFICVSFISLPLTRVDHDREPAIVSCAGYYDDDESILRWTCHTREVRDIVFS